MYNVISSFKSKELSIKYGNKTQAIDYMQAKALMESIVSELDKKAYFNPRKHNAIRYCVYDNNNNYVGVVYITHEDDDN